MTTTMTGTNRREHCDYCKRDTQHTVNIELRAENVDSDNSAFSREPYRVATCVVCEDTNAVRMNDA